jgi:tetratricopeptide (TPR) repeat protein
MNGLSIEVRKIVRKNNIRSLVTVSLMAVAVLGLGGCDKLKARDQLNRGIQSFKDGKTDAAIEDFKRAVDLDPNLLMAKLYLGTAYQSSYIPGATSDENQRNGKQALEEYQQVLSADPSNLDAIDRIGALLNSMASTPFSVDKLNESKTYWQKHISIKPDDPEPYYWIGLIDWNLSYKSNMTARADYNRIPANYKKQVKDDQPMPPDVRAKFAADEQKTVDEGYAALKKAVDLKPDYDDAIAYLSLMDRQKADMTANPSERDDLLKNADTLMDQVKQIKQKKATAQPGA